MARPEWAVSSDDFVACAGLAHDPTQLIAGAPQDTGGPHDKGYGKLNNLELLPEQ